MFNSKSGLWVGLYKMLIINPVGLNFGHSGNQKNVCRNVVSSVEGMDSGIIESMAVS